MKVNNTELIAMGDAIALIAAEKLNIDATLHVRAIRRALEGPLKDVLEVKNSLVTEYGETPEGAPFATINPASPRWAEFLLPYGDLLKGETELPEIKPLTRKELWRRGANGEREPIDVTVDTIDKLGVLFSDEEAA